MSGDLIDQDSQVVVTRRDLRRPDCVRCGAFLPDSDALFVRCGSCGWDNTLLGLIVLGVRTGTKPDGQDTTAVCVVAASGASLTDAVRSALAMEKTP